MKELGLYMRQRRELLGFTQEQVSRRIDISLRQIAKWETGNAAPSIENFARWLIALGVDYTEIEHFLLAKPETTN
ncbi:helix-turn-helix domain-containing protein [Herpetosiphon geysericola]|uniref:HTH cro/C1-type domain-containing protein n=1 Tax=Herpetosiphon geysericola TaxID=70996 RepID=A0A0P6XWZ2_9CHLR|nr:helix-turn-helix transcriptional regulator [Herpetosiphon geysericola]KPL80220.1 hypothetical protein SE18_24500 [Herpetosiphon geysericola]